MALGNGQMAWLDKQKQNMVDELIKLSSINSGSTNLAGLDLVKNELIHLFSALDAECEIIPSELYDEISLSGEKTQIRTGDILLFKKRAKANVQVVLSGHMDTVFAKDSSFQVPKWLDDNTLNGPGVADMKGGLLVMLYALLAFEQSPNSEKLGWQVVINSDEEIGSRGSSHVFNQVSQLANIGLVYEPTMNDKGVLAGKRKGSGKFTITAQGKAAHAGRDFEKGKNAIYLLSEAITQIHKLNGLQPGLTINVGLISGGAALNVVPEIANAKLDVRIADDAQKEWFRERVNEILQQLNNKQNGMLSLEGDFYRPPKPLSEKHLALFNRVKKIGAQLGLEVKWQDNGGCCDGNNLAASGLAVVDTLGVRGGNIHRQDEYILVDSLVERAKLSALLLMNLAQD